ncbi:frataxin homolog, mitochondrial [Neodiprion lecontei]|uniref:ferroxidase n=1 Tax=Neodiprion lecontei TaxID=441921 RepID=A0A6J0BTX9_NEOLC|nr:frataxin homolog, mitochondrial [Neodiprion lecontei]
MISRIVRSKPILKTLIKTASNITHRTCAKEVSNFQKSFHSFEGYVKQTVGRYSSLRYKTLGLISTNAHYSSQTPPTYEPELELNSVQFDKISSDTLESLTEYFDELIEKAGHLEDADVSYGDGVLTVKFGKKDGTYVINRQTPNKQIWLSSPKSGPKRYDFVDGKWVYKHDGKTLHDLLNKEIPAIIRNQASFDRCSYSGKEQYSDKGLPSSIPD